MKRNGKSAISIIIYCAVIGICLMAALYVCAQKKGFHEDEYYTYYSSNRTDGLWAEDGTVTDRQTILNEFSVVPGEGFNFPLVKEVQSWDVHPPVYYFAVHLVCSVTQGVFSKWQGLAINLVCLLISLLLIMRLEKILIPYREMKYAPAVIALAVGTSAATLTAVAFIRMYMLLTVWILAVTILHAEYLKAEDPKRIPFYAKLAVLTFLGFMTHYYFFIWLFFLAVAFNLYELVTTRSWWGIVRYGAVMVVTFGLCYVFYPAWPAQMFKGQRGAQATGNFFDLGNTGERIAFFADKINRIGFGGLLWTILALTAALAVAAFVKSRKKTEGVHPDGEPVELETAGSEPMDIEFKICILILAAAVCYFLVVSKTALMLGDSSIRYQMPVLGTVTAALAGVLIWLLKHVLPGKKAVYAAAGAMVLIVLAGNCFADLSGKISFLYPEEEEHAEIINGADNAGAVYVYDPDSSQSWCIWDSASELMQFDSVLFLAADSEDELSGEAEEYIDSKDTLFVYVDDSVETDKVINRTEGKLDGLSTKQADFTHEFCNIYILN